MKKLINIPKVILFILLTKFSFAYTGIAYIENAQVNGLVFSWELHFERTDAWPGGLLSDAIGNSAASFDFNNLALINPSLVVEPGGPLDNANYPNVTVQIVSDKCIVDIPFALNTLAGQLPLNVKTKLLSISMTITNTNLTAGLSWDVLNTGFFSNSDSTIIMTLAGGSNTPLPVELTSFTASYKNQSVILSWKTETEVNNYGFTVERRISEGNWNNIGFVEGSGNSNSHKEYSYSDSDVFTGGSKFQYRLKQVDNDGTFEYSDIVEVEVVPNEYELSQNYPNPFNPSTTIRFSLPKETQLKINIYNMLGELVETLAEGSYEAGYHKITFNANNLPSGTYVYRLESSEFVQVKKLVLLK